MDEGRPLEEQALDLQVLLLQALEFPRSVGDVLFLFPSLKDFGRSQVERCLTLLSESGLVSPVELPNSKLWRLTDQGALRVSKLADWQLRCTEIFSLGDGSIGLSGILDRGVIKVGDWFHDGRGSTGRVTGVDAFDSETQNTSLRVHTAESLSQPLVLRRWEPTAGSGDLPAWLQPAEWEEGAWESDLFFYGSLPDITAPFATERSWDTLHAFLQQSGLRWEFSHSGIVERSLPSASTIFADKDIQPALLKVWVGPLQFNAHYFDATEADFDIEIEVLSDRAGFECLVAFMDWVAAVTGAGANLTHEGGRGQILTASAAQDIPVVMDALRLADLRNPVFVSYRDVLARQAQLSELNVDEWLEQHSDPEVATSVLNHVHMYDVIESVDDEMQLARLAQQVAQRWREALETQVPERDFLVGVDGEPDEYGPTVWLRPELLLEPPM